MDSPQKTRTQDKASMLKSHQHTQREVYSSKVIPLSEYNTNANKFEALAGLELKLEDGSLDQNKKKTNQGNAQAGSQSLSSSSSEESSSDHENKEQLVSSYPNSPRGNRGEMEPLNTETRGTP